MTLPLPGIYNTCCWLAASEADSLSGSGAVAHIGGQVLTSGIWITFGDALCLEASELRKKLGMESAGGVCLWEATI